MYDHIWSICDHIYIYIYILETSGALRAPLILLTWRTINSQLRVIPATFCLAPSIFGPYKMTHVSPKQVFHKVSVKVDLRYTTILDLRKQFVLQCGPKVIKNITSKKRANKRGSKQTNKTATKHASTHTHWHTPATHSDTRRDTRPHHERVHAPPQ